MLGEKIIFTRGYRVDEQGTLYSHTGKKLKCQKDKKGYSYVCVRIPGEKNKLFHLYAHRLQAFQKYGELIFSRDVEVRHLNGNPRDNSYANILIGSHRQNTLDIPVCIRTITARIGASHKKGRYSNATITAIKKDRLDGYTYKELMDKYDISSKGSISYICNHTYRTNALYPKETCFTTDSTLY